MPFLEVNNITHNEPILKVQNLSVHYGSPKEPTKAVDSISFELQRGETLGLVGESGCGKSSLGRAVLRLETIHSGSVVFKGTDITKFKSSELKKFRREAQIIFQDPYGSLNPRMTVGAALEEVLAVHRLCEGSERRKRASALLQSVGLEPMHLDRYPHEFSGGQRQRIGIARALALNPELIIADEPVSALDVSIQVQILNLLKDVQTSMQLSYLFIAHDLAVVRYMCSRVMVMYLGRMVEMAPASKLYSQPSHPYTLALLAVVPDIEKGLAKRRAKKSAIITREEAPRQTGPVTGCAYHPRCAFAQDLCRREAPPLREVKPGQFSACHFADEVIRTGASVVENSIV